jgi:hypothetical protein
VVNIQLPPERELQEPLRTVDRILEQTRHAAPPRRLRIRPAVSVAVAAAITVTAGVLGIRAASPDRAEVGRAPGVTAMPQPPTAAKPPARTSVGATVTFPDLAVTVHTANQIKVNSRSADEYTIFVTTCLRRPPSGGSADRVRLMADFFTLNTGAATITIDDPITTPLPTQPTATTRWVSAYPE